MFIPANITIMPLPPKCPELNPVENIWQYMRDNWLSNRVFKSYDDIVDHCCYAWNTLIDRPWKIMSIGLYQIPEAVTPVRGYPNQHPFDSTWRTMEVRHAYPASC